jgi:hypothetical protein
VPSPRIFLVFFSVNFFIPKLMKIRWSFLSFGSFAPHFQIKLNTHGSNLNSIFVNISELELFLLMGVLTQNFNTVDLVKFLEKNSKTSHLDHNSHIEDDIMRRLACQGNIMNWNIVSQPTNSEWSST